MEIEKKITLDSTVITKLIEDHLLEITGENMVLGTDAVAYFLRDKTRMLDYVQVRWKSKVSKK